MLLKTSALSVIYLLVLLEASISPDRAHSCHV